MQSSIVCFQAYTATHISSPTNTGKTIAEQRQTTVYQYINPLRRHVNPNSKRSLQHNITP